MMGQYYNIHVMTPETNYLCYPFPHKSHAIQFFQKNLHHHQQTYNSTIGQSHILY